MSMDDHRTRSGFTSRREVLRLLGLGAVASLAAACQPAAPASPTATTGAAKPVAPTAAASPAVAASPASSPLAAAASPIASAVASPSAAAKPTGALPTPDPAMASVWQNKTVTMSVGFTAGGGNDTWARLAGRHIGRFLPGTPTVIVNNVPGAGGVVQVNQLYESKPDGLSMGLVERGTPILQMGGQEGIRFDCAKLGWLGSAAQEGYYLVIDTRSGASTAEDLLTKPLKIGQLSPGTFSHQLVVLLRREMNWQIQSIFGYQGQNEAVLAMDRGEVQGVLLSWSSLAVQKKDDLASGRLKLITYIGAGATDPMSAGVPSAATVLKDKSEETKQMLAIIEKPFLWSRPYAMPPNTPPAMLAAARAAFAQMVADPQFLDEAAKVQFDVSPVPGAQIETQIGDFLKTPPDVFNKLKAMTDADTPS
jgi:tripartite-type tricarboxylate transporter receptor subunit TctC